MYNVNYHRLQPNYLFAEMDRRIRQCRLEGADDIINLGIGDVTQPVAPLVATAMQTASAAMADPDAFHGYPPAGGYERVRRAVADSYRDQGIDVQPADVYISDGAKSDIAAWCAMFGDAVGVCSDPCYPVFADCMAIAGANTVRLPCTPQNGFLPMPDNLQVRRALIYLCSPHNPCGVAYSAEQLQRWVEFAVQTQSIILFDAAYSRFAGADKPASIYAIDRAKECCIEVGSLSKSASFSGLRFGWSIVPAALQCDGTLLAPLWRRRQSTMSNGVSYVTQAGALAALSAEGVAYTQRLVAQYKRNAQALAKAFAPLCVGQTGGTDSPYLWLQMPDYLSSWQWFDRLLWQGHIAVTPGAGLGAAGEGYIRISCFASIRDCDEAAKRVYAMVN